MANDFLERYRRGECEAVWTEVTALGDLRDDVEMQLVAVAIAQETMQRVKMNIRTLAQRLQCIGFRFGEGFLGETHAEKLKPFLDDAPVYSFSNARHDLFRDEVARIEDMTGGLPVALRVFYEVVGSVNLVGAGPMWKEYDTDPSRPLAHHMLSRYGSDPLFVQSPKMALEMYYGGAIFIAPNYDYKFGIGGGSGPYEIRVPCATADASLENEWHQTTFVDYLRICCRWGGFPGLEYHRDKDRLAGVVHDLTHDLLPF